MLAFDLMGLRAPASGPDAWVLTGDLAFGVPFDRFWRMCLVFVLGVGPCLSAVPDLGPVTESCDRGDSRLFFDVCTLLTLI